MKRLTQDFYEKSAIELAPEFLGKLLCRNIGGEIFKYRITETECYCGEDDTACHAHKGKTLRTKIMYEKGGAAYVYLCYGIHFMFNIVTGEKGSPEAVLVRAAGGYNGPGKLTKALKINISLNAENLITSEKLWIEDDGAILDYYTSPRIGIDYAADKDKNIHWRYVAKIKADGGAEHDNKTRTYKK